jgi:predicted NUDIX family NTP pyrophosphohydrolase
VTIQGGKRSAGLLMYRRRGGAVEVLLIHPGGPFWSGKDDGAWSIPKGSINPGEDELLRPSGSSRRRPASRGGRVRRPAAAQAAERQGHRVLGLRGRLRTTTTEMKSNLFSMEWPPRSGKMAESRGRPGPPGSRSVARTKIIKGQKGFIEDRNAS